MYIYHLWIFNEMIIIHVIYHLWVFNEMNIPTFFFLFFKNKTMQRFNVLTLNFSGCKTTWFPTWFFLLIMPSNRQVFGVPVKCLAICGVYFYLTQMIKAMFNYMHRDMTHNIFYPTMHTCHRKMHICICIQP